MKHSFLVILIAWLIFGTGCEKSAEGYMATGSIIGPDIRVPSCGGGTWIQIDKHPNPNNPVTGYYDMGTVPPGFHISDTTAYPIRVELDYTINSECLIDINISRIKIIN
jgi:hypothetical protein